MRDELRISITGGLQRVFLLGILLACSESCQGDDATAISSLHWDLREDFQPVPELTNPMADANGFGTV